MYGYGSTPSGDVLVTDRATKQAFHLDLWDVSVFTASDGDDLINVKSGYYTALNGSGGAETINISAGAYFYTDDAGAENDTVSIDASLLTKATSINGGAGTDKLIINTALGGTFDLTVGTVAGFESMSFDARTATAGATTTAANTNSTLLGSAFADTLIGGSGNDIIIGGGGSDTLTGGAGADIFVYASASQGGDHITDYNPLADQTYFEKTTIGNQDTVWDAGEYVTLGSLANEAAIRAAIDANGHTSGTGFLAWNQFAGKVEAWHDTSAATTNDTTHVITYDNVTLSQYNLISTPADAGMVLVDTTTYGV